MGAASLPFASAPVLDALVLLGARDLDRVDPGSLLAVSGEAARLGRAAAERLDGGSAEGELARRGIAVRRLKGAPGGDAAPVRVAALAVVGAPGEPDRVDLYLDEIARKHEALLAAGVEMGLDWLVGLHLAHELYHVVELGEESPTEGRVGRLCVHGLLGRSRSVPARRAGEVAAHAFAHALAGGPHPALVDVIAAGASDPVARERFARGAGALLALMDAPTGSEE